MGICSYCGTEATLTREHIIPSWYYKHEPSSGDMGFMEKAKGKIVTTELKIKDVCASCNNEVLSQLDDYGKSLFFSDLVKYVYKDTVGEFKYDYGLLLRWLLKVSYNSARAHGNDLEVLDQYKDIILGKAPIPAGVIFRLRTIAPTTGSNYSVSAAFTGAAIVDKPDWFRVGVFRVEGFDSIYWAFRHVTINSYSFLLYLPSLKGLEATSEAEQLEAAIRGESDPGVTLGDSGVAVVPVPEQHSISFTLNHIGNFPLAYELIENEPLKMAINGEIGLVNYWIDRKDIEEKNIGNALEFLTDLVCVREIAMGMNGKVELSVHGYDNDPRELYEIPEVIAFMAKLDEAWPYWMLFQHSEFRWLQVLSVCLCYEKKNAQGLVEFDQEKMHSIIYRWFNALNELSHKFAISVEVNKSVSDRAMKVIYRGMVPT